ncbi:PE family protein [Mycobacterium vicinigordonae]|uniref:PE-PPE domain-containing protein n=1 Tax=Mycobacterium vicinigordonae TaxID=1719132 RepID=A0A7D6E001_9MYCO|nr:PE-PPE domain-containing protein [Mycobacterium vicinigordonae]QLL07789.1 PE-PPE domain-containing protein [Mycobacterium vicinigordonae]
MSYVFTQPPVLAAAATELAGIGSALGDAAASAAGPTTKVMTAAADEVSATIANFFGAYGQEFQALNTRIGSLYDAFVQRLTATVGNYADAEALNTAQLVQTATAGLPTPTVGAPSGLSTAIVMGGTGMPAPTPGYVDAITRLFLPPGIPVSPLFTPEQLYPITGVRSLPLATSVQEGLQILNGAVSQQLAAGNHVTVFGYSQSAIISSLLMQHYISLGPNMPDPSMINFILTGNEMNPNGGILARIPGLNISTIGLPFYGATPDGPYQTTTYTIEYDGFADFPRYPLNFVSDLNAVFGILTVHTTYVDLTPSQIASATLLPTEGTTNNQWYMIRHPDLPLLDPVRAIPVIGQPLAALVQPDLKVIVNLGYGDPNYGYSTSPANVATPFGLFPNVPPEVIANALIAGTQQGISDFAAAVPVALSTPPVVTPFAFPPLIQQYVPAAPPPVPATPMNIANTLASVVSTGYSVLLPTADLATAFATTLPAYDATLFLSQLAQGNLVEAIQLPLAATTGLVALGGMIEFISVVEAAAEIAQDLQSLSF